MEFKVKDDEARSGLAIRDPITQEIEGACGHLLRRLPERGQGWSDESCPGRIVDADERDILRDALHCIAKGSQGTDRHQVVGDDESIEVWMIDEKLTSCTLGCLEPELTMPDGDWQSKAPHHLLIPTQALRTSLDLAPASDEANVPSPQIHQMLGGETTSLDVVGEDGIGALVVHSSVERHDGDIHIEQCRDGCIAGIGGHQNHSYHLLSSEYLQVRPLFFRRLIRVTENHTVTPGIRSVLNGTNSLRKMRILDIRYDNPDRLALLTPQTPGNPVRAVA